MVLKQSQRISTIKTGHHKAQVLAHSIHSISIGHVLKHACSSFHDYFVNFKRDFLENNNCIN